MYRDRYVTVKVHKQPGVRVARNPPETKRRSRTAATPLSAGAPTPAPVPASRSAEHQRVCAASVLRRPLPLVVRRRRRHGPHPFAQPALLVGEGRDVGLGVGELGRPEQRVVRAGLDADPAVHAQREVESPHTPTYTSGRWRTLRPRLETRIRTTEACELGFGTKGPLALPNLAVVVDQEQPQALPPQPSL